MWARRVKLTILRAGKSRARSRSRAPNVTVPVASSKLITYHGKRLGYLAFSQFTEGSADELRAQVQTMLSSTRRA